MPPSPEVAEHAKKDLAQVIGQSVAYHVAALLTPVLQRLVDMQERYACLVCAAAAKRAERAHEIAVANAKAAAEPEPENPGVKVSQSFTDGARGPVCWGCYDPDKDGPYDMADYLPAAAD
jgi:hypothetical protein